MKIAQREYTEEEIKARLESLGFAHKGAEIKAGYLKNVYYKTFPRGKEYWVDVLANNKIEFCAYLAKGQQTPSYTLMFDGIIEFGSFAVDCLPFVRKELATQSA